MDINSEKKIEEYLSDNRENYIKDLRGLLRFNSISTGPEGEYPFGRENAKTIDYMMDLCADAGFETINYDYYCMEAIYGEGDKSVATMSHLDIVPAGDGWKHPPFAGEMEGSLMFGRGVGDDKGPSIAAFYALKALISTGVKLNKQIKLIYGCNEESGMADMLYYLTKTKAPDYAFSPDAGFPVIFAEKNGIHGQFSCEIDKSSALLAMEGGTVINAVPAAARAVVKTDKVFEDTENLEYAACGDYLMITAHGIAAHAASPDAGENAAIRLINAVVDILDDDCAKLPLKSISEHMSKTDGSGLGIDCSDDVSGELTMNLGIISFDKNILNVQIDIRQPVTLNPEACMKSLDGALPNFNLSRSSFRKGLYRPKDGKLVKTLQSVYQHVTGDMSEPIAIGGGTYASKFPNAVAFGPGFPGGSGKGAHMVDECADVDEMLRAAKIYALSLYELSK